MTLIAIDPGITTGVAIHTDEQVRMVSDRGEVRKGEYITLVIHKQRELFNLIKVHSPTSVIFEDFNTPGRISKDGIATVRLIGAIEAITASMGIPTVLQFPIERLRFLEPARSLLKVGGKKFLEHEMDALAHLLLYEDRLRTDSIPTNRRTNDRCNS